MLAAMKTLQYSSVSRGGFGCLNTPLSRHHAPFAFTRKMDYAILCRRGWLSSLATVDPVGDPGRGGVQGCKGTSLFSGVFSPSRRSSRRLLRGEILRVLQNV